MLTLFPLYIIPAVLYVECTVGIILNVFIVANNLKNWRRHRTLQTCEKILILLATSRCLLLFEMMLLHFLLLYFPRFFDDLALTSSMSVVTMLLNYTNFFFATILCVFYCVKITNYNCFIFLKSRISTLVHWFIVISLIISVALSLPSVWCPLDLNQVQVPSAINATSSKVMVTQKAQVRILVFIVGSFPPFIIFCMAMLLLILSLWMHIRHMKSNGTTFAHPSLEVHFSAVKSMSFFLVWHLVYYTCMNLLLSPRHSISTAWKAVIFIIICSPLFLHSLYIIFSTKKLKETFLRWFCCR